MKIINKLHPLLSDSTPVTVDDPRPFLERIIDTIHCPDILEDDCFWKAMNQKVFNGGHVLVSKTKSTGTSVKVLQ